MIIKFHVYKSKKSYDESIHRIKVWLLPVNLVFQSNGVSTMKLAICMSDRYELSIKTTLVLFGNLLSRDKLISQSLANYLKLRKSSEQFHARHFSN